MNEYLDSVMIEINRDLGRFKSIEVLNFINYKKYWTDKNFLRLTFSLPEEIKVKVSTLIYIDLLKTEPLPFKRIWRCKDIIFFTLISQPGQEYLIYLYQQLNKNIERSISSVFFSFKLLKSLNIKSTPFLDKLENTLKTYLKKCCKKAIFKCSESQTVKYLGLALELNSFFDCQTECLILVPIALQLLENKYNLYAEDQKISSLETKQSYYSTGIILYFILKSLFDSQSIQLIQGPVRIWLKQFDTKVLKSGNIKHLKSLRPFPYLPKSKKNPVSFDMTKICIIKTYLIFTLQGLNLTYNQANYKNSEILLVIYDFQNDSIRAAFKEELAKIMNINLLLGEKYCFQQILAFSELKNCYYVLFEPFYSSLIELLTILKESGNRMPEDLVKGIAKKLIFSFRKLEKEQYFHGNLKPHFIFCNDNFDISIGCFPVWQGVDYDLLVMNKPLIQGHSGYTAPDVPAKFDYGFNYLSKKADVFSAGMILLQLVTLDSVEDLRDSKERMKKTIKNVPFEWLRCLLERMLRFKAGERSSFEEIYSDRGSIFV